MPKVVPKGAEAGGEDEDEDEDESKVEDKKRRGGEGTIRLATWLLAGGELTM